ncbi:malonyl-ACP O-methyltransferase BioC [Marinomonas algarum]|uniref:Malonyl-[acyl-carrier protein] O-methyltransferase n=1 Tax=Marinomonas algarum TaxID=2883105 RepID=A0A9X1IPZ5_9GAMM|nr:malonyl-ACP O-methyltransferase BioC [Marinomonas algarum]MCB5161956.1 malonyl-ACP O-methyltransferase BioC [Marinomonas algarum]
MLITPDHTLSRYKQTLAQRFDRASLSYDAYADFQRIVLRRLLQTLPSTEAEVVLDLGAGTGQALDALVTRYQPPLCVALDLSSQMLSVARAQHGWLGQVQYVCADAEQLPMADDACHLVFSSLAVQWCLNPRALFEELYRITQPGGYVVFSTLLQGSMEEVSTAWRALDGQEHVHRYDSMEAVRGYVEAAHWSVLSAESVCTTMWFESAKGAIDSLKKIGASLIASQNRDGMSPSKWKAFLSEYEKQRCTQGVPLSYQVSYIVARKPMNNQEK